MIQKEDIKIGLGGEIISGEITRIKKCSAEEFCQLYLKDNNEFFKLTQAEHNVLGICMYVSTYFNSERQKDRGNMFVFNTLFTDTAKEKTGLSVSTIKNSIANLVKKKMIIKDTEHRGVYYLNPLYFFKGKISDRTSIIKSIIEYQIA